MTTFLKNRDMKFSFHLLLACIALTACGESGKTTADYRIVPCPGEIAPGDGGDFELDARTRIICTGDNDGMRANAEFLAGYVESVIGSAPEITGPDGLCDDGRAVILRADAPGKGGEAYEIEVSENRITVRGESDAGVVYGIQTLRKAMGAAKAAKVLFPAVRIADEPYLGYRGVMLDVGRTFYPVEEVKRIIDLAALHNLNVFHWHLTDDQGWRIEIDAYPRLTETGAFRRDTTLAGEPGTFGGYYTKRQIRDIVEYAARRYIEVVPEIDMPGHMTAALASYPELGCTGGPYVITPQPGVRRDILCAGNPAVFDFVEKVLEEVIGLFPSKYIHIGGDESPRTRWRECPKCQSLIRRAGLKADTRHSAEDKLQGYFNTRIEKFLSRHGRRLIGWDEIVDGGMSPDATVMSWRGTAGGIRAADEGFMTRLDRLVGFYDRDGYSHFPHFYDITGAFTADYGRKAVGMTLSSLPGADICYTLDGSEPTEESPLCTDTVWIGSPAEVRAVAVLPNGRRSEPFREEVTFNKATMKPIRLLTAPHPKYAAAALNDGLRGKRVFTYGNWAGWQDDDMEAVIDLGRQEEIAQVAFNALLDYGSHIMDAAGAKIWVSDDGETFREVHSESYTEIPYGAVKRIFRHEANFSPALQARYVKLRVMRSAQLPDAYFDRNLRPFLFIDEIYVY